MRRDCITQPPFVTYQPLIYQTAKESGQPLMMHKSKEQADPKKGEQRKLVKRNLIEFFLNEKTIEKTSIKNLLH
jgi:ribosome biogenesis protein Tsr3